MSLDQLAAIFGDRNLFPRRRAPPLIKALAVKAYVEGLSFRRAAKVLGELGFKASHEAVRDCVKLTVSCNSSGAKDVP